MALRIRCPRCAAQVVMEKVGENYRGDCACGFRFRGEAPAPLSQRTNN